MPMYVELCIVIVYTIERVGVNRVRFPILLLVSRTRKMNPSLSPIAPENLVSRDGFGSPDPRQPAHLHTPVESGAYVRNSSRVPRRRPCNYLNRHTPSGQSRVYRATQLRTDGVHCRESAGTGPVSLKVVPNECCLGRSPYTNQYAPFFMLHGRRGKDCSRAIQPIPYYSTVQSILVLYTVLILH